MAKLKQIGVIILVLVVFVSAGIVAIVMGARSSHVHYVCLEVNPRVEFLTDAKHNVTSLMPLNQEAKELLIQEEFVGIKIGNAVNKFLTLCAKAGYLKVDGEGNAVKLSVLSGLNQGLEVELSKKINNFFVKNQIMGVLVDSSQDLQNFKDAKKNSVSPERYDLMLAVQEDGGKESLNELKKLSSKKLIDKIKKQHEAYDFTYTETELNNKVKLIDFNRENYDNHMANITNESTRKFKENLVKYTRENAKKYKVDYNKQYNEWVYG